MHGVHVLRRVGRGHSLKNVDAIILDHNMAEGLAKDQDSNPEHAIPGSVQVCIIFVIKTYRVLVCKLLMKIVLIANRILILLSSFCQPDAILIQNLIVRVCYPR